MAECANVTFPSILHRRTMNPRDPGDTVSDVRDALIRESLSENYRAETRGSDAKIASSLASSISAEFDQLGTLLGGRSLTADKALGDRHRGAQAAQHRESH